MNSSQGGGSKDTWVLAEPHDQREAAAMNGKTSPPLLSRVADSVYWMARYIERAENVARFIDVNLNLQLDLPLDPAQQWQPLIDTSGDSEVFIEAPRRGDPAQRDRVPDLRRGKSQFDLFLPARGARKRPLGARNHFVRNVGAGQQHVPAMHRSSEPPDPEWLPEFFRSIRLGCHLFQGITDATMTHNEAWHFARLGRKLERADKTSRILDVKYFMLLPSLQRRGHAV